MALADDRIRGARLPDNSDAAALVGGPTVDTKKKVVRGTEDVHYALNTFNVVGRCECLNV